MTRVTLVNFISLLYQYHSLFPVQKLKGNGGTLHLFTKVHSLQRSREGLKEEILTIDQQEMSLPSPRDSLGPSFQKVEFRKVRNSGERINRFKTIEERERRTQGHYIGRLCERLEKQETSTKERHRRCGKNKVEVEELKDVKSVE